MVDFVKVLVKNSGHLLQNDLLSFERKLNERTGEVRNYVEAEYDSLKFRLYDSGLVKLQGSLHKFYNGGVHNYNDYSLDDLLLTLDFIEEVFGIDLSKAFLENLEIGLNIQELSSAYLVISCLLSHKNLEREIRYRGSFARFEHSEYEIKVYDKAKQNSLKYDCLRVEVKYIRSRLINKLNLFTLSDFKTLSWLKPALNDLCIKWSEIVMYDPYKRNEIPNVEWQLLSYWAELSPVQKCRELKKLRSWNSGGAQFQISQALKDKWRNLSMK